MKENYTYPENITENFDIANFHIKYCLSFIKKYLKGDILEVGAGCGSFTRNYFSEKFASVTLTEKDKENFFKLSEKYKEKEKVTVTNNLIYDIDFQYNAILYLHVLEHIKDDKKEIDEAIRKLKKNGYLIILVPAHQQIYSNLDKEVGHFRRYESDFFKQEMKLLKLVNFKYLDSAGYLLYKLNSLVFSNEKSPTKLKIFIWDKFFTPFSLIFDFILMYKFGKCILAIYQKE